MANQRKTIVASALNVAGDFLKAGIGLGALGVNRLNKALRGASATVGGGIQDAREAAGHVAEGAEALLVEFGQSFQGQAGVPAAEKTAEVKAIAKPEAKTLTKKAATSKTPAKAKAAAKPKTTAKPKASTKPAAAKPAKIVESAAAPETKSDTPPKAAAAKAPAAKKAAPKKPAAAAKATPKPAVQAATSMASEETPPPSKLH